jgi:hypothetical protein
VVPLDRALEHLPRFALRVLDDQAVDGRDPGVGARDLGVGRPRPADGLLAEVEVPDEPPVSLDDERRRPGTGAVLTTLLTLKGVNATSARTSFSKALTSLILLSGDGTSRWIRYFRLPPVGRWSSTWVMVPPWYVPSVPYVLTSTRAPAWNVAGACADA